jgi:hypothetical protein
MATFSAEWNPVTNTATVTFNVAYEKTSSEVCRVTLNGPIERIHEWDRGCVHRLAVIRELSGIYNDENRHKRLDCNINGTFTLSCAEFKDFQEGRYTVSVASCEFNNELEGRVICSHRR